MPKRREQPVIVSQPEHLEGSPQTSKEKIIRPQLKREKAKPRFTSSPKLNQESDRPDTFPSCSTIDKNDLLARADRKTSFNEV